MKDLSVVLPVYKNDNLDYLELSLNSIFNQSYQNFDLIIVVDGPIPQTLKSYLKKITQPRLKELIYFKRNRGLAFVLNDAIKFCLKAGYKYIARMDADDIALPSRFEEQISYLELHKDIDILGTWIEEIDENSQSRNKIIKYPVTHKECYDFFKNRDPVCHPAVMFRSSVFDKIGLYPTDILFNEDTNLWYEAFKHKIKFANIPKVLFQFRITMNLYKRRGGISKAWIIFKKRLVINESLGYGFTANISAFIMLIIKSLPLNIIRIAYRILR